MKVESTTNEAVQFSFIEVFGYICTSKDTSGISYFGCYSDDTDDSAVNTRLPEVGSIPPISYMDCIN